MICPRLRYHICAPAISSCFRALWLYVRVDFLRVLWWLAEATQTWPHLQHFYGTSCLGLCSPFLLAVLLCFHALPQRFTRRFSQFGLQCEDFLSFPRPFTSFPDSSSSFFYSQNFQSFSSFSVCFSPPFPLKVPFYFVPFPFLFLSHSVWWKLLQCGARVPVVSMPTGCQAAARARSQGRETERQNERERAKAFTGFTELLLSRRAQRQYLAPLLTGRPRTGTRASRIPSSCYS